MLTHSSYLWSDAIFDKMIHTLCKDYCSARDYAKPADVFISSFLKLFFSGCGDEILFVIFHPRLGSRKSSYCEPQ